MLNYNLRTEHILVKRGYLLAPMEMEVNKASYYSAKLLNTFGVLVDKPHKVVADHVQLISEFYGEEVPESFYSNPQDLKYFTTTELFLEQLVSYMNIELIDGVFSEDPETFKRIELFKKALPNYKEGEEVVFRNYKIIEADEAVKVLKQIAEDLALYTRKWSESESEEFNFLFKNGYVSEDILVKSKDNA